MLVQQTVVGITLLIQVTWTITGVSSSVLVLDRSSAFVRFIPDSTNGTTGYFDFPRLGQSDGESNGSTVTIISSNQGDAGILVQRGPLSLK